MGHRQCTGILGRDEEARLAVDDHLFAADDARGHHRQTRIHHFEQHERHSLMTRREHEHIRCVEQHPRVAAMSEHAHVAFDAQVHRLVDERLMQVSRPHD